MTGRKDIVTELHRLIDEQMKVLQGKLSRQAAIEYGMRSARIEELIALLNEKEAS